MGSSEIAIRTAAPGDLAAIFRIYNHEVEHEISTFDTTPKVLGIDDGWLTAREPRYPVIVADEDGGIRGWASLSQWSPRGAYSRTAEVSVYVDRDHHGRGLGRRLLSELIGLAPAGDIDVLLARVVGGNPSSMALHHALGFHQFGIQRRCGEKFGRILDVALLDLHLDLKP